MKIRAILIISVLVLLFPLFIYTKKSVPTELEKDPLTYTSNITSEICNLCGTNLESDLLGSLAESPTIGLIHFDPFSVSHIFLDRDTNTSGGNVISFGGANMNIVSYSGRLISEITVRHLDENHKINGKSLVNHYCQNCLDSILENNTYDFAFINYITREIYPITNIWDNEYTLKSTIDIDYYKIWTIRTENDDEIKMYVVYAPLQEPVYHDIAAK